jgi:hypothetical protein
VQFLGIFVQNFESLETLGQKPENISFISDFHKKLRKFAKYANNVTCVTRENAHIYFKFGRKLALYAENLFF